MCLISTLLTFITDCIKSTDFPDLLSTSCISDRHLLSTYSEEHLLGRGWGFHCGEPLTVESSNSFTDSVKELLDVFRWVWRSMFFELFWDTMPWQSHLHHLNVKEVITGFVQKLYLKSTHKFHISAVAVHFNTLMLIFGCVVGVNPAPTIQSRSSLPCIAPWQFYNTSLLGHNPLRSGCFPSAFVEESEGPNLLQCCIPISDRYRGKIERKGKAVLTTCSQSVWTIQSSDWATGGHSEDTNMLQTWHTCM